MSTARTSNSVYVGMFGKIQIRSTHQGHRSTVAGVLLTLRQGANKKGDRTARGLSAALSTPFAVAVQTMP
jgi:hypothetical protein